jgi:hypothetical protein
MLLVPILVAHGKDPEPLALVTPVTKSDPNWKRIQEERKSIENPKPDRGAGYRVESVGSFQGEAQKKLLPNWRFYLFDYRMFAKKGFERKLHIAPFLKHTLAMSPDGKTTVRIYHGSGTRWMAIVKAAGLKITDSKSAKLVWDAWCETHRLKWKHHSIQKDSETVWRLGITSYDQTVSHEKDVRVVVTCTHHVRVAINPKTKLVTAWKDCFKCSDPREVRAK